MFFNEVGLHVLFLSEAHLTYGALKPPQLHVDAGDVPTQVVFAWHGFGTHWAEQEGLATLENHKEDSSEIMLSMKEWYSERAKLTIEIFKYAITCEEAQVQTAVLLLWKLLRISS